MNRFTARTEVELPRFNEAFSSSIKAFIKIIPMLEDFNETPSIERNVKSALELIDTLDNTISESINGISNFQTNVDMIPRLTSEINKSRRALSSVCDRIVSEFENGRTLLSEAKKTILEFILPKP